MRIQTIIAVVISLMASPVLAQSFPSKPVTLIVPFAAGGPTDTLARNLGAAWGKGLKQTVIIENVGGAGGNIGVTRGARANRSHT